MNCMTSEGKHVVLVKFAQTSDWSPRLRGKVCVLSCCLFLGMNLGTVEVSFIPGCLNPELANSSGQQENHK